MSEEEKILWMFKEVHGEFVGSCHLEVEERETEGGLTVFSVNVMKDGNLCWSATKTDLVFDYLTKHL